MSVGRTHGPNSGQAESSLDTGFLEKPKRSVLPSAMLLVVNSGVDEVSFVSKLSSFDGIGGVPRPT